MGRARTAVAGAIDAVITALATARDRIDGDPNRPEDRRRDPSESGGSGATGGSAGADGADAVESGPEPVDAAGAALDGNGVASAGAEIAPADDGDATPDTPDRAGITGSIRGKVGAQLEYHRTALRHPIAAQRVHVASLAETSLLSTDFLKEALVTESVKRDRVERIRDHVESDRTVRDDARAVADVVDWSRTWRYGKYGFLAGRRYRKRLPVADEYAPVATALAGGVYGAVSGATDRSVVDVDPEGLFDRIDAVARIRDDPVTRARVARETLHAVDRRVGNDDLPIDDVLDDGDIADLVTHGDEAVPDDLPGSGRAETALTDLVWGDPLPGEGADRRPGLPPGGDVDGPTDASRGPKSGAVERADGPDDAAGNSTDTSDGGSGAEGSPSTATE